MIGAYSARVGVTSSVQVNVFKLFAQKTLRLWYRRLQGPKVTQHTIFLGKLWITFGKSDMPAQFKEGL